MAEPNSDEEDSCRSDEDDGDESTTSKEIEDEGVDEIGESAAHEYPGDPSSASVTTVLFEKIEQHTKRFEDTTGRRLSAASQRIGRKHP